jgi:hypothetical protein
VRTQGGWRPIYLKGVNLGVALPGRYPSEFPTDSATYADWLEQISGINANVVRLYTILPPAFYGALRAWNLKHADRLLWLVQGIWAELPPANNFANLTWEQGFQAEMRRVVDLTHGAAAIRSRPGHASGRYDADVSSWVLGYIIGREWEPFAVRAFNARHSGGSYQGHFLRVKRAPAMDLWLAQQCDGMLDYEFSTYHALRPIAYTNWPTLDPLNHPTEATNAEERYWRRRVGRPNEAKKIEYENDAVALDANLVEPTSANPAGWFASYHAYPYYPDFMSLDPEYRRASSEEGPSSYFGYLRQLVAHHPAIPTLIAEYGVPSSRGMAHLQWQGWHHGGHDESSMAAIDARLTREIRESGAAGSIVFAWLDEWFKKNWAVADYEIPGDNTRAWHNVMDAEQNYGILGQYSGDGSWNPQLGGDPLRWQAMPIVQQLAPQSSGAVRSIRARADESFIYIAVEIPSGRFPWAGRGVQLAVDTYRAKTGQHRLPRSGVRSEVGFEFLMDLESPDSGTLAVTPDYQRYDSRVDRTSGDDFGRFSRRPVVTRDRDDARFDALFVITNRGRFARDGRFFPAQGYDRGRLQYGKESASTLADWFLDEFQGLLEIRIPWDLLNVTDPSTRTLLYDQRTDGDFGTVRAEDFHFGVVMYNKGGKPTDSQALPQLHNGFWRAVDFTGWRWPAWILPQWHERLKPVYDSLKAVWREEQEGEDPSAGPDQPARPAPSN